MHPDPDYGTHHNLSIEVLIKQLTLLQPTKAELEALSKQYHAAKLDHERYAKRHLN